MRRAARPLSSSSMQPAAKSQPSTIAALFEAQVVRTPEVAALTCGDASLSYDELNTRANHLAHDLIAAAASVPSVLSASRWSARSISSSACWPSSRPAAPMRRSIPTSPHASSGCWPMPLRKSSGLHRPRGAAAGGSPWVCVDPGDVQARLARQPDRNPPMPTASSRSRPIIPPMHDLHVGLDGHSERVSNTHRGLVNRLLWMQDAPRADASDSVLQKTPCSFDVSVWEFFWPPSSVRGLVVAVPVSTRIRPTSPNGRGAAHHDDSLRPVDAACVPRWLGRVHVFRAAAGDLQR